MAADLIGVHSVGGMLIALSAVVILSFLRDRLPETNLSDEARQSALSGHLDTIEDHATTAGGQGACLIRADVDFRETHLTLIPNAPALDGTR